MSAVTSARGENVILGVLGSIAGLAFVAAGIVAWRKHPGNVIGPLMIATGFAYIVARGSAPA